MPSKGCGGESRVLAKPVTSKSDKKDYKAIELPNGLRCLLVSDTSYDLDKLDEEERLEAEDEEEEEEEEEDGEEEEEDDDEEDEGMEMRPAKPKSTSGLKKSAAGLSIGMGSFADPEELQGLAHFLEHMVFMGSSKFPDENSFDQFIQKHGGFDNAHTDAELTTFYFETQRKHFREGLDRFAQFFIDPLMKKDAMQREREAVDSEFQMALPSDTNRRYQIIGSVMAKRGHPITKFMWGNLESLQMSSLSDDEVHKKLHEFRLRHYTAQSMTLVVQSQETLDTLEKIVVDSFSAVPNNSLERVSFKDAGNPFIPEQSQFHKMYKIVPNQDVYQLDMAWSLPPLLDKFRVDPLNYISFIVGHEGRGSLISYLRKKVWALGLAAGNAFDGFDMNETYSAFAINIQLTKEGHEKVDQVILTVFSYLKMLRESPANERIFNELKKIKELDFEFGAEPQPMDNVENLCEGMQLYPPEMYLTGGELIFDFDAHLINECCQKLNPDGVNICLTSKDYKDVATKVERWFKTRYVDEEFAPETKDQWKSVDILPEFFLPEENVFIADNVSVADIDPDNSRFPVKILSSPSGEMYYRQDDVFKKPRVEAAFNILSPLSRESIENAVCLDLFVNTWDQLMSEDAYPASQALFSYSIAVGERGEIEIKLSGLNDKMPLLLKTLLKHWKEFNENISEDMFEAVKRQTKKNYFNFIIKPNKIVRDLRLEVMLDYFWPVNKKHAIIDSIELDTVKKFLQRLSRSDTVYVQSLVQGNMSKSEALKMFDMILEPLEKVGNMEKTAVDIATIRCKEIPPGEKVLRMNGFNPKDTNSLITNYYQAGIGKLKDYVMFEVMALLIEEPVFDVLRTKEQLGYTVFSTLRNSHGVLGMSITVNSQANKFSADHVDERIEAFVKWFVEDRMANLEEDEFLETVDTLIKMKKTADVSLKEEFNRNWREIADYEYAFDIMERSIEILEGCKMKDVTEVTKKLLGLSPSRRKLSVQVVGNPDGIKIQEEDEDEGTDAEVDPDAIFDQILLQPEGKENFVGNAMEFKSSLNTYPPNLLTR